MMTIDHKRRKWLLGAALLFTCILVWWVRIYSPWQDERDALAVELAALGEKMDRLKSRQEKISADDHSATEAAFEQAGGLIVSGKNPEEVSAFTQLWLQEFLEGHGITLINYRGLGTAEWKEHALCRVQFNMTASIQGLADLLESLEAMEKAIRIETLTVESRRGREKNLRISLELGTLFAEGLGK